MKRTLLCIALVLALCLSGCGAKTANAPIVVLDAMEYTLYQNYFFNSEAASHVGETQTKTGIFTTLYDSFNNRTRYYVWGYADQTKCCDWQWELVLADGQTPPANGSKVKAVGTWEGDDAALDKYWFTGAKLTVEQDYAGAEVDVDLTTMSSTLARVEIQNFQSFKDAQAGRTIAVYARVKSANELQHPYYDGAWVQSVSGETLPAIGTFVTVEGELQADGTLKITSISAGKL